ncbi:MAG: transcription-repair coupling factor [Lachnospira sp.]|nr:transcription-repair coupling factor [Lachnospira sp.]
MSILKKVTESFADYDDIKKLLNKGYNSIMLSGCIDATKAHLTNTLGDDFSKKLIITHNELRAKELLWEYSFYDKNVYFYPAKDFIFFNADIHGNLIVKERITALKHLIEDDNVTIITTLDACAEHLLPIDTILENVINIAEADVIDTENFKEQLIAIGYERVAQVEMPGQFSIRGGIFDVYPLTEDVPVRIDFIGDEIDTIRSFDVESQRSIERIEAISIYPAKELIFTKNEIDDALTRIREEMLVFYDAQNKQKNFEAAERIKKTVNSICENFTEFESTFALESFIEFFKADTVSFLEYFNKEHTLFVLDEPNRIDERMNAVEYEFNDSTSHRLEKGYILPSQTGIMYGKETLYAMLSNCKCIIMSTLDYKPNYIKPTKSFSLSSKNISSYNNSFELLVKDIKRYKKMDYRIILVSNSSTRAKRLVNDFMDNEIFAYYSDTLKREMQSKDLLITTGNIKRGFEYPLAKFVLIAESDIFGARKQTKKKKKIYDGSKISSFNDLIIGDYVIHENHGLGIYRGIEKVEVNKTVKDYIKIEYANNGSLYILATQLELIQKYAGSDAKAPKLNKLGGQEWDRTKTRVRSAVSEIAKDLVTLYATREAKEGFEFSEDTLWQKEFEEMFPFEETSDQLDAIAATKADMQSKKIMERLICGDVGFGKTEIAIRAAFKAVQDGKQVIYLVPTTILAQQHFNTFSQRMKDFAVNVELMSRFRTPKQIKETIEGLKTGRVDIVIGTHRVLSKDVAFKDLGLLIIDEEQRFGVSHKEKIKHYKDVVDVLTLTATPIPRTLHMSLIGIRDMSILEEAPIDRMPIQTFVTEYNEEMIREAIMRELSRSGQVYYVYNRVNNIEDIAAKIQELIPDANVAYAHGQMEERRLEQIMLDFINGEIDVLVSTTIIETGLDISNVNTIIIHDADKFGLSQLYQLRGRVGRSNRTAYAFLLYKRDMLLKETAEKRLAAIKEFTELGSGFKIAMKDLEIRGAGNLLGEKQHGHMEAVGYDLYCKMLNEEIGRLKNTTDTFDVFDTSLDIDVDAYIPATYIKSERQKLDIYKRIADLETEEEIDDMLDELIDRFGEPPQALTTLLNVARIKAAAHNAYITEIRGNRKEIKVNLYKNARLDISRFSELDAKYRRNIKFKMDVTPYFTLTFTNEQIKSTQAYLETIKEFVEDVGLCRVM